ncbi:MAG: hypothetical protein EOO20_15945 [Chryseobacterium sp.]|nr:MAG: hypothetical protein EOO20_15945 [Chryseobacterium sp.]
MRKLNRKAITAPEILVKKGSIGSLETAAAIAYYGVKIPVGAKVEYKAYGHASVKKLSASLATINALTVKVWCCP